jgi:hypothetical protein
VTRPEKNAPWGHLVMGCVLPTDQLLGVTTKAY